MRAINSEPDLPVLSRSRKTESVSGVVPSKPVSDEEERRRSGAEENFRKYLESVLAELSDRPAFAELLFALVEQEGELSVEVRDRKGELIMVMSPETCLEKFREGSGEDHLVSTQC